MRIEIKNKKELLKASLGLINCDLLIKNANLVNVITGEIYPANVFVYDGMVAHVEYKDLSLDIDKANTVIDANGKYLIPGLIDAHEHIESSMMTPRNFAKAIIPHGTTTVVTDPHEIANVWGIKGVRYMHDSGSNLPMRQYVDIPSCVPAVPGLENGGAEFLVKEIESLFDMERVIGLAEVMDFLGVINGEDRMMDIINAAQSRGLYLQGHAPFVSGRMLSAYLCGGPNTCHETRTGEEGLEKLRSGMYVDARDSSISKNVKEICEGVKDIKFFDHLCFCTDDREADDILNNGHMNDVVSHAIKCGIDPVTAIKSATYNIAKEIRMENLGAIAPGFVADMLLLDDITLLKPSHVFYQGKLVAENGKLLETIEDESYDIETENSMHVKKLTVEDFIINVPNGSNKVKVNLMEYQDMLLSSTLVKCEELNVENGRLSLGNDSDLKFVAVVNRHKGNDSIGLGVIRGFGITCGALASTVSHDCHNLTIVYDTPENALLVANELIHCGGGMSAVMDQTVLHTLALPVAGLMSLKTAEELAIDNAKMKEANRKLGLIDMENPLLRIVTVALPVIPEAKMSDLGLVDVFKKELIPLFAE